MDGATLSTAGLPRLTARDLGSSVAGVTQVVVDAANVIGSRPDGWWRDRAAAAQRLIGQLELLARGSPGSTYVVVLEGAARAAEAPRAGGPVQIVHAPRAGDDEIVHQSASADVVVTADRELRRRVAPVTTEGPGWLLAQLDAAAHG